MPLACSLEWYLHVSCMLSYQHLLLCVSNEFNPAESAQKLKITVFKFLMGCSISSWSKHSYAKSLNEAALEISQKANGTISFCKVKKSWLCKILFTSIEKIYQEPGLESFNSRHWFRKLCRFSKIFLLSFTFNGTRDFQTSPPFERSVCFYVTICESFKRFQYFNFETNFLEDENLFQKTRVPSFSWNH